MKSIKNNNSTILFNEACYIALNEYVKEGNFSNIFILVDTNTHENCLPYFLSKLVTNVTVEIIEIEPEEINKTIDTCTGVWNALSELGADRKSLMINLGGGVITDLGGFVASCFKRGIDFINIPTTLLSMVDASVGGKTGVDLGVLKNQIGLFSDPEMVLIDPLFLKTVSERELRSGLAEIIKYGLTYDVKLWDEVVKFKNLSINNLSSLVHRSIEIKNEVVTEDPKEGGIRKVLNYGHTLGHAVESYFLDAEHKEKLTHGEAIVVGMITEAYLSEKLLSFPSEKTQFIKDELLKIYPKIDLQTEDYSAILELLVHDKKNVGGQVNFVLLTDYEKFELDCKVKKELLIEALDYYCS